MEAALRQIQFPTGPNVLVGSNTADDAGVYRLREDLAIVQTVDFFTPMVDDPYAFGLVAAANALSDVYAMGAKPVTALNVIAFPEKQLPMDVLVQMLKGGLNKATEAGVFIIGGHTIKDDEPKYGLSVTGIVHPDRVIANSGAKPGDRLFLTKPLGSGIITTAVKREMTDAAETEEVVHLMATLNRAAAEAMVEVGVHACTDVTGFGLLGHLHEMTAASGVSARISASAVPVLPSASKYAELGAVPGGSKANLHYVERCTEYGPAVEEITRILLADAQTSGGLLIAVSPDKGDALRDALTSGGVEPVAEIGEILRGAAGTLRVDA